jgi:hypothetical protein
MTTISYGAPLQTGPRKAAFFIVIALLVALGIFSLGMLVSGLLMKPLGAGAGVGVGVGGGSSTPLKPCASCPSCACPKMLGSVKCLCAK